MTTAQGLRERRDAFVRELIIDALQAAPSI